MHGLRAMIAAFLSFHAPLVAGQPVTPLEMPFKVLGARRDSSLERIFRHLDPWIGGDSADSVPIGRDRVLWLFGDSYLGHHEGKRRVISGMIRNAVAIREGTGADSMRFFPKAGKGTPRAFFHPDGVSWVWPCRGGLRTEEGLYVFLPEFRAIPGQRNGFGFKPAGMRLVRISHPDQQPDRWKWKSFRVPWPVHAPGRGSMSFANPFFGRDGRIYLPGMEELPSGRHLLMARCESACLENFAAWKFLTRSGWSRRPEDATRLCDHVGAELSVSWKPFLNSWLLVTTENGLSARIVARTARDPWGPWGGSVTLYRAPEPRRDSAIACYAGKEHPELAARGNEVVISYVCNASPEKIGRDPALYTPLFVRLRLTRPEGPPIPTGLPKERLRESVNISSRRYSSAGRAPDL